MALPRDDSVFSGHVFDSVGTPGRYVNSAAAIVATAASTGLVKMHFTACKKGAATERARVHLCHAVPRVTASCRPLYLLIIIGLRTINDANYSFLLIAYTAVHDTSRYTSAQHDKNEEGGAGSAGAVGAAAAAAAAAAADPVLAAFDWLREDRAPGVCWSTHPERAHTRQEQRGKEAIQRGKEAK